MRKHYEVPPQVWADLEYEAARSEKDCIDNFRAYRVKDNFLKKEYIQAFNSGCCGVFESSTIVDGDKWIIGFNYGH